MSDLMPNLGFNRLVLAENLPSEIDGATVSRPARRTAVSLAGGVSR